MSADVEVTYGRVPNCFRTIRIRAVDSGDVPCSGSVTFKASYGGREIDVLDLITPALHGEIILNWRALQRLGVIPYDFPRCTDDQVTTKKTIMPLPQQEHEEKEMLVTEGKDLKTKETDHVINCTDDTIDLDESVNKLMKEYE